jgi:hypothetical protein
MRRTKISCSPSPCVGPLSVTLAVYRWLILMKTVSRINTVWLIIVTYRTEWEPCCDREIIDFATWYVMSTGVLCASLGSRVIAGARLLSLVPSCSLQWKINDSFVQFSAIRVRQAYSHLRYLKSTGTEPAKYRVSAFHIYYSWAYSKTIVEVRRAKNFDAKSSMRHFLICTN